MGPSRDQAILLSGSDWKAALTEARAIEEGWYACQAFAYVAKVAPEEVIESIVAEAVAAAATEQEPYDHIAVLAWPLRALVERGRLTQAEALARFAALKLPAIAPAASRSEAAFMLFQATFGAELVSAWCAFLDAIVEAADTDRHWRVQRNVRDALLMVAAVDRERARALCERVTDEKLRSKLSKRLDAGESSSPRSFFH